MCYFLPRKHDRKIRTTATANALPCQCEWRTLATIEMGMWFDKLFFNGVLAIRGRYLGQ